ncbi:MULTISPECIES: polysaccharide deacetylase family protein [unclassified Romboutsia]|uniref:polysaccharide deacetylase family protein n=1 Tax=unclassified Romboutsia TaxID=2626894 RepID=UPI000F06E8E3|nr:MULTISPECIES: polysaccharide deacetylase family protein [unclassified Romboutsia]
MLIMVANKKKLKKIGIGVLVILLIIGGVFWGMKSSITPTFNFNDLADLPYERGTKANSGYVAITCNVDLGWEDEYIESILDTLKKEDANITFTITGKWAENKKELLQRMISEGHEVGSHGYKHLDYAKLSYEENLEQMKKAESIIEEITNQEIKFFQAPAGSFGEGTIKAAKELGYTTFKWDVDTIDWKYREEPDVIINRVNKKEIKDGSIVLIHPTKATTQCLDDIISIIRGKGLKVGRLMDIF